MFRHLVTNVPFLTFIGIFNLSLCIKPLLNRYSILDLAVMCDDKMGFSLRFLLIPVTFHSKQRRWLVLFIMHTEQTGFDLCVLIFVLCTVCHPKYCCDYTATQVFLYFSFHFLTFPAFFTKRFMLFSSKVLPTLPWFYSFSVSLKPCIYVDC